MQRLRQEVSFAAVRRIAGRLLHGPVAHVSVPSGEVDVITLITLLSTHVLLYRRGDAGVAPYVHSSCIHSYEAWCPGTLLCGLVLTLATTLDVTNPAALLC